MIIPFEKAGQFYRDLRKLFNRAIRINPEIFKEVINTIKVNKTEDLHRFIERISHYYINLSSNTNVKFPKNIQEDDYFCLMLYNEFAGVDESCRTSTWNLMESTDPNRAEGLAVAGFNIRPLVSNPSVLVLNVSQLQTALFNRNTDDFNHLLGFFDYEYLFLIIIEHLAVRLREEFGWNIQYIGVSSLMLTDMNYRDEQDYLEKIAANRARYSALGYTEEIVVNGGGFTKYSFGKRIFTHSDLVAERNAIVQLLQSRIVSITES